MSQTAVMPRVEIGGPDPEVRRKRALLLIDERCATSLNETVASLGASHVTVVAVPRLPALWMYAPLSGLVTADGLREVALADAQRLARRAADAVSPTCSVDHRVLGAWRDVIDMLRHGSFHVAVLAVRPGRRAHRLITAAGLAAGTAVTSSHAG